jgi:hypothetical protein
VISCEDGVKACTRTFAIDTSFDGGGGGWGGHRSLVGKEGPWTNNC